MEPEQELCFVLWKDALLLSRFFSKFIDATWGNPRYKAYMGDIKLSYPSSSLVLTKSLNHSLFSDSSVIPSTWNNYSYKHSLKMSG